MIRSNKEQKQSEGQLSFSFEAKKSKDKKQNTRVIPADMTDGNELINLIYSTPVKEMVVYDE